jgi:hypothetical protein
MNSEGVTQTMIVLMATSFVPGSSNFSDLLQENPSISPLSKPHTYLDPRRASI